MRHLASILVGLLALSCVALSAGSSTPSPEGTSIAGDTLNVKYNEQFQVEPQRASEIPSRRFSTLAKSVELILTGSVLLGFLFLLLLCAKHISTLSRSSKSGERRLAEGNPCGGDVSDSLLSLRCGTKSPGTVGQFERLMLALAQ